LTTRIPFAIGNGILCCLRSSSSLGGWFGQESWDTKKGEPLEWLPPDFPVWGVIGTTFAAFVGSLMFGVIRPSPTWTKAAGMMLGSTCTGAVLTQGLCHWYGVELVSQHMVISFIIGLLAMPLLRSLVAVSEEDGRTWIKKVVGRVFGYQTSSETTDENKPSSST
jgi:hypothetical protein